MGRNMFGPIRGEWDEDWRGWWGPEPPYHAPVFVLSHHAHEPSDRKTHQTDLPEPDAVGLAALAETLTGFAISSS